MWLKVFASSAIVMGMLAALCLLLSISRGGSASDGSLLSKLVIACFAMFCISLAGGALSMMWERD